MKIKYLSLIIPLLLAGCYSHPSQNSGAAKPEQNQENAPVDATKSIFDMGRYSQQVDKWLPPSSLTYHTPVMSEEAQARHFLALKSHYFGNDTHDSSPWNKAYIDRIVSSQDAIKTNTQNISAYLKETEKYYGINFRRLTDDWKLQVKNNALVTIPDASAGRAIVTRETLGRALPTLDPVFNDPRLAGEGYPFDNIQISAIHAGTPLYVLATSNDKAWKYVVTPTVALWVKSADIASVDDNFVATWRTLADKQMGAYIKDPASVHDSDTHYFMGRPGTILPLQQTQNGYSVAIPVKQTDGSAQIKWVSVRQEEVAPMPLKMTPTNIAVLMKTMQGKQYGWGSFNFYNDCSMEMRSLMMPFGIFLPRNSAAQAASGRVEDMSKLSVGDRLDYLTKHGKPFTTLIHINGHIMLYIGNTELDGKLVPMTYQNVWGLHTKSHDSRSIIGGSVFFPLLANYPESADLISPAAKPLFQLSYIE